MARATMDELRRTEPDRKVDFIAPEHAEQQSEIGIFCAS